MPFHIAQTLGMLNPVVDPVKGMQTLADLQGKQIQNVGAQQTVDANAAAAAKQKQLQQVFAQPGAFGADGNPTPATLNAVRAIDPDHADKIEAAFLGRQNVQSEIDTRDQTRQTAIDTLDETIRHNQATETNASDKLTQTNAAALRKQGLKTDADGNIIPIDESEMSATELSSLNDKKSLADFRKAQSDLAEAKAEAARNTDPNSAAAVKARQAQERLDIAKQRLGLSSATFNARYEGTDANGAPLPGAMIADDGRTVGTSLSANVRPTGTERNKADMAISAHEQLQDIRSIVQRRPDIFGPLAGRTTDFTVWLGSQDPDAQAFRAARTIAGDHLAGTFGGRSETALTQIDNAIGQFKDNPAAVLAGLDQIDKANQVFISKGTPKTVGSNAAQGQTGTPKIGDIKKFANGKTGKWDGHGWVQQ